MKTILLVLVVAVVFALLAARSHAQERSRRGAAKARETDATANAVPALNIESMLWAIRQVESGDNPRATGALGERTAYQFRFTTWKRYSTIPLATAVNNPALVERVARQHLAAIIRDLAKRGFSADPLYIAAAWNFGGNAQPFTRAIRSDYAQRCSTLYWDREGSK